MKLSTIEKTHIKADKEKDANKARLGTDEYFKWLPRALEHMARTTFDQRIRTGYGSIEKCATDPIDLNKSTKRGQRYAISDLCDELGIPRVSFYKWRKRQPNADEIAKLDNDVQVKMYIKVRENNAKIRR